MGRGSLGYVVGGSCVSVWFSILNISPVWLIAIELVPIHGHCWWVLCHAPSLCSGVSVNPAVKSSVVISVLRNLCHSLRALVDGVSCLGQFRRLFRPCTFTTHGSSRVLNAVAMSAMVTTCRKR